jgi:hypothetical protein
MAKELDKTNAIDLGEVVGEPNILIDDDYGISGNSRDYALVVKKIAHRTGKVEDGENEGKVIRYTKWEDVSYAGTIFECLRSYQDITNLTKIKALKNCKDYLEVEKIYKETNAKINQFLKHQDMSKETKDAISLIDTINQLHDELNKAKEVIKDANDFKAWIKEKRQILISDTEPKKHRMKLEK